jgi:hypothetical protein
VQEFKRGPKRRIGCIVTLNADDILEQAVLARARHDHIKPKTKVISVVERPSNEVIYRTDSGLPIGVYHIHGFLPSHGRKYDSAAYMLVFTDAQYWNTSAAALTFANRVMASALNEGPCIFIGLSMTDINMLRWLALRTLEWNRDEEEEQRLAERKSLAKTRGLFSQHFWIRPASDDPTELLSMFLEHRGIHSVELESWIGPPFQQLMQECFP